MRRETQDARLKGDGDGDEARRGVQHEGAFARRRRGSSSSTGGANTHADETVPPIDAGAARRRRVPPPATSVEVRSAALPPPPGPMHRIALSASLPAASVSIEAQTECQFTTAVACRPMRYSVMLSSVAPAIAPVARSLPSSVERTGNDISARDVRGSESNCEHDSRKM